MKVVTSTLDISALLRNLRQSYLHRLVVVVAVVVGFGSGIGAMPVRKYAVLVDVVLMLPSAF